MILVIIFLLLGIFIGIKIRRYKNLPNKIDSFITIFIYLLLFTLGLKAGSDDTIVSQLHSLGLTAFIITLFAITGSVLLAWLTFAIFFKNKKQ